MKRVTRFGEMGKLSPHYIGPYQILRKIGKSIYELELPVSFALVHPVLYVSMLKKSVGDHSLLVPVGNIGMKDSLMYVEVYIQIIDFQVQKLRTEEIISVKVM